MIIMAQEKMNVTLAKAEHERAVYPSGERRRPSMPRKGSWKTLPKWATQ
jgi:hypothetical protein